MQPVGCLVPYNIGLESLLIIMKQFACVVKQLNAKGYLHGDLSYYNLLKHQDTDAALLVDMQTLMPLQQVLILGSNSPCCKCLNFCPLSHVNVVAVDAQAARSGVTGTPLFMGWNVVCKRGHSVSTELESLMYVLIFILTGGILPWRHVAIDDRLLPSIRFGVMASCEFSEKVLSYVRAECHSMLSRLRDLFFLSSRLFNKCYSGHVYRPTSPLEIGLLQRP